MPKGHGGRRNEAATRNGRRVGRPPKYTTLRVPTDSGRFPLAIPIETIGQAQRLMLDYPECQGVEEIIALAVAGLAQSKPPT